ncbi:MAG: hypothetical protein DHS20C09_16620 [marine bacterium B5-7]|nr:MAG: hypothetical protein DHS20C09_16620 [marine bacterium B5-7]
MSTLETLKRSLPTNTYKAQNIVSNTWENFVGTGKLNHKELRPVIASRWQRCRELAINPFKNRAQTVLSDEELESRLHTENLGISGKNVLDKMTSSVEGTGHAIILADSSGKILYSVGHKDTQNQLEKINFKPGSDWHEDFVGPNGIGTTIGLGQPELILGSEHFCRGWQPWVCYGAPIHNPRDNTVLGCVDITGPANKVCIEAMALAMSITQSIESELSVIQLNNREKVRLTYCNLQLIWPNQASLVVDECGNIVDMNSHANTLLNPYSSLINHSINNPFPDIMPHIEACMINGSENEINIELKKTTAGIARLLLKPIKSDDTALGCFVMVIEGDNIINDFTTLRSKEDDLIRNTLLNTNNNISKAAKILNIDRTTIYRRRKKWQ